MSILLPEIGEESVELDLEFDAPQWDDLQKEKDLVEQGNWSAGSDIYDSWFKKVHPLHEAKTNEQQPQRKSVVDRKGNKLSLEASKTGPTKNIDKEVNCLKGTNKALASQRKSSGSEHANVKKPRKCWDLDGCHSINISPNHTDQSKHSSSQAKHPSKDLDSTDIDEELRAMLDSHNRRIMKQRAEYDENGRRIQKGNPVTCPAPTNTQTNGQNCNSKLKSKRRSVNVVRAETMKEAKQKRRSCFTLSTRHETSPKLPRKAQPNRTTTTTVSTTRTTVSNNHKALKTTAGIKRQKSFKVAEKLAGMTNDAENEIKELIAQHNSKLAAKRAAK